MPKKGITPRKHTSDLSPHSSDLRGPIGLSETVIDRISADMKRMIAERKRQLPHPLSDAERMAIYEAAAAPYGATAGQARLIAFRSNAPRSTPKDFTLKTSPAERAIWGRLAKRLGISIKGAASLALLLALAHLGLSLEELMAEGD